MMKTKTVESNSFRSPRHKAFADYYIETVNATESAKRAGYSQRTARSIGQRLLTYVDIQLYIEERLKEKEDARIAKQDEVLRFLTSVMRGEIRDQFGLEASLADRIKAAELLGKRYRLFVDRVEADVNTRVQIIDDIEADGTDLG